jgi:hypothetical protein
MDFVSEKTINGKVYVLVRSADEPWRNFVICDEKQIEIPLGIWHDENAIERLF